MSKSRPDQEQLALTHMRKLLMQWKPRKRGRGRPPGRQVPRTTGGLPGRKNPWRALPPWVPFAVVTEAWLEMERRHPKETMTWLRVLRTMTRPQWQLRDADPQMMRELQLVFRHWRDREDTLRKRLMGLKRDLKALADARTVLEQNRPEALGIFDRVFARKSIFAGFSDK